jgi:alpha-beta hydrolase superfamily lysophospholipase
MFILIARPMLSNNADEMEEYFALTKRLIEDTYARNGNSPVVVVAHSMGNTILLHFYNYVVTAQWKDKYIRAHVAIAAPWAGSVKALKVLVSGQ